MKFNPICKFMNANWCQSEAVFEVPAICTNLCCEMATPLAYCCDLLRLIESSIVAHSVWHFCLSTTTMSQLHHHKVRVAQMWWLYLTIELATVSVIHLQKNGKYDNNHIKVMTSMLLASSFHGHSVHRTVITKVVNCCSLQNYMHKVRQ